MTTDTRQTGRLVKPVEWRRPPPEAVSLQRVYQDQKKGGLDSVFSEYDIRLKRFTGEMSEWAIQMSSGRSTSDTGTGGNGNGSGGTPTGGSVPSTRTLAYRGTGIRVEPGGALDLSVDREWQFSVLWEEGFPSYDLRYNFVERDRMVGRFDPESGSREFIVAKEVFDFQGRYSKALGDDDGEALLDINGQPLFGVETIHDNPPVGTRVFQTMGQMIGCEEPELLDIAELLAFPPSTEHSTWVYVTGNHGLVPDGETIQQHHEGGLFIRISSPPDTAHDPVQVSLNFVQQPDGWWRATIPHRGIIQLYLSDGSMFAAPILVDGASSVVETTEQLNGYAIVTPL